MNQNLKKRFLLLLKLSLSCLIIGLLLRIAGWAALETAIVETRWTWMVAVYLAAVTTILVNASLLRFLLRTVGLQVGLGRVLFAKFQSTFFSLVLPGDMFAGLAKWANLSVATGDKAGVLSAMVFSKIALAVPPILVGSIALATKSPNPDSGIAIAATGVAIAVIVATGLILQETSGRVIDGLMLAASRRAPAFMQTGVQGLLSAIRELRTLKASGYVVVVGLSVCVFGLSILSIFFAAQAVNVTVPVSAFFWVSMFLFISRLLPITVGNLGVREGILVFSFGLYGVDPATAILVGLLMFSSVFIVAVIGAGYQIAIAMGWVDWNLDKGRQDRARTIRPC